MVKNILNCKIFISFFSGFFLVYKVSFYFDDIVTYMRILFGMLLGFFSSLVILNCYRFKKIDGKRFFFST
jgi:hypothetical protein